MISIRIIENVKVPVSHLRMFFIQVLLQFTYSGKDTIAVTADFGQLLVPLLCQNRDFVVTRRPVSLGLRRGLEVGIAHTAEESSFGVLARKIAQCNITAFVTTL